jgi:hypothetical protein
MECWKEIEEVVDKELEDKRAKRLPLKIPLLSKL